MLKEAPLLSVLLGLFCLRVLAQMVVAFTPFGGALPPMEAFYSGLMPYGALLPCQWAIIALFGAICRDFWRAEGRFVRPHRGTGRWLRIFAMGYLVVMVTRYAVRMSLHPHERWVGGSLPIFFHWVLAGFLLVLAHYHARHAPSPPLRMRWRILGWSFLSPLFVLWIFYFAAPHLLAAKLAVPQGPYAVRTEKQVGIAMDDNVILRAALFKPQHLDKAPTLLVRINHGQRLAQRMAIALTGRFWAEHGYFVVAQGVRGRGDSDGVFEPFVHERADGLATLRWLEQQSWFNGRVGTWGGSYFGYTQWSIADQPEVQAMMVQEASTDFYDMLYPGGVFSFESALNWAVGSGPRADEVPDSATLARGFAGFPHNTADTRAGHPSAFFQTWTAHPTRDGYWQGIDTAPQRDASRAQVLFLAGWFDPFLPAELRDHAAAFARGQARSLWIGPWCHACSVSLPEGHVPRNYRFDSLAPSIAFFDATLRDVPSSFAPVRYFMLGENAWHEADRWPPADASPLSLRLHGATHRLDTIAGPGEESESFVYDPTKPLSSGFSPVLGLASQARHNALEATTAAEGTGTLTYATEPLRTPWLLAGPHRLELTVRSDAPCTTFVATLLDVWPDGREFAYTQGAQAVENATQEQMVHIDLWPLALRLAPEHRLALRISSSSHPRFAAHPNVCGNPSGVAAAVPARQVVRLHQSALVLSVLPAGAP